MGPCLSSRRQAQAPAEVVASRSLPVVGSQFPTFFRVFIGVDRQLFNEPQARDALVQLLGARPKSCSLSLYRGGTRLASSSKAADGEGLLQVETQFAFTVPEVLRLQLSAEVQGRPPALLGNAEVSTSRLVTADAQTLSLPLRGGCVDAACSVRLTEATEYQTRVFMAIQLVGDPQPETTLVLSLMDPQQEWIELHRAQAARDRWPPFELTFSQLRGDLELPLRLQVFRAGGRLAGQAVLRAQALRDASVGGQSLQLSQPGGRGVQLKVNEFAMRRQPSFLDYVFGGCQVRWLTGIDFSAATRGAAGQPSIHQATGASMPSPCEAMVTALGSILEVYSTGRAFPVWGFGGRITQMAGAINPCYPLNGNSFQPDIQGVQAVLSTLQSSQQIVTLDGPTRAVPVLEAASDLVDSLAVTSGQSFCVVTILLAGPPADADATLQVLREASGKPLVFIFLGIGGADFRELEELVRMHNSNHVGQYITAPVEFHHWASPAATPADPVAQQALAQVPLHLLRHFQSLQQLPQPRA